MADCTPECAPHLHQFCSPECEAAAHIGCERCGFPLHHSRYVDADGRDTYLCIPCGRDIEVNGP